MVFLLVVINDLHIRGTGLSFRPRKTNPPLIVYANAVLAFAIPFEGCKAVAGQGCKVRQRSGRLEPVQLQAGGAFNSGKCFDPFAVREVSGPLVAVAYNHL